MTAESTICVDDNLTTRETGIALGTARHETPRRIDVNIGIIPRHVLSRHDRGDDTLDHVLCG